MKYGEEIRRAVMGDEFVDAALKNATDFTSPLQEYVTDHAWGATWTREGLDLKTRSLERVDLYCIILQHTEGYLYNAKAL